MVLVGIGLRGSFTERTVNELRDAGLDTRASVLVLTTDVYLLRQNPALIERVAGCLLKPCRVTDLVETVRRMLPLGEARAPEW